MNSFNKFDDYMVVGNVIYDIKNKKLYGFYRNGVEVLERDMTEDEKNQAHAIIRKYTFDIIDK